MSYTNYVLFHQQMPEYWSRMVPQKCNISLMVEGSEVDLATWNINTDLIVPEKDGSEMAYSCQRNENLLKYPKTGPESEHCMGRESPLVHIRCEYGKILQMSIPLWCSHTRAKAILLTKSRQNRLCTQLPATLQEKLLLIGVAGKLEIL